MSGLEPDTAKQWLGRQATFAQMLASSTVAAHERSDPPGLRSHVEAKL